MLHLILPLAAFLPPVSSPAGVEDPLDPGREELADAPLDEVFRSRLFEPLGMTDTDFAIAAGTTFRVDPTGEEVGISLVQNRLGFGPSMRSRAVFERASAALEPVDREDAPMPRPKREGRSVLFYTIDTCRADRLSVYGHDRPTTPFLDELAAGGVVFERCSSQAAWTKPSMASLLTSKYPAQVGIFGMYQRLGDEHVLFPEVLAAAGFMTAGFSANPIMGEFSNYIQGFRHFTESAEINGADPIRFASGSAKKLNAAVFDWLDGTDAWPSFLYVHAVDPHEEYEPAPEYLERFADPARMETYRAEWQALLATRPPVPGNHLTQWNFDEASIEPEPFLEQGRALYDADLLAADTEIERLWQRLQDEGWGDDVIVIVTSDHGEEFFEHGGTGHGYSVYDELVHVPFIVYAPGLVPPGTRITAPVRSLDIYPTLLDLLDLETPDGLQGRSLVPLIADAEGWRDEAVFSENTEDPMGRMAGSPSGVALAMRSEGWTFISNFRAPIHRPRPRYELYDLGADPGEQRNVADENAALVERFDAQLTEWYAAILGLRRPAAEVNPDEVDPAVLEDLRRLGYVGDDEEEEEEEPDPNALPAIGDRLPLMARAVLEGAPLLQVIAVGSEATGGTTSPGDAQKIFYGHPVLDRGRVRKEGRGELLRAVYTGIAESDGRAARCFMPRHGIRANHGGHTADLVICYECFQMRVYLDGTLLDTVLTADVAEEVSAIFAGARVAVEER